MWSGFPKTNRIILEENVKYVQLWEIKTQARNRIIVMTTTSSGDFGTG
jgi:hypothetical protein